VLPVVGVLALQGDVAEHLRALEQAGARPLAVRRPAALDEAAGLVIPGGESSTIWKLAVIFGLIGPLRKRVAAGMPVFGSCAGMIMLAGRLADPASGQETLGAIDMTVRRNAFGRQADSFETDLSIAGLHGGPYRGVFIRAPWAERVGGDAEVLAAEPRTGKFVAVRQGPALATAFHPELTSDRRIHELFVNIVRQES
jgi:5'-phosphate synthase pdxT subunit